MKKLYTKNSCPICAVAKDVIKISNLDCEIIHVTDNIKEFEEDIAKFNIKITDEFLFPVFIDEKEHIILFGTDVIKHVKPPILNTTQNKSEN